MTFGVDTVKPDQRIMEVLDTEIRRSDFEEILSSSLKLTPSAAICMIHKIAKIAEKPVALTDQIFVKYGSGYYLKN